MATHKNAARDKPRHSANFASGTAKKKGAGGRGTWGSPEQDYKFIDEDIHAIDRNDPNYDEEEDYETTAWGMYEPPPATRPSKSLLQSISSATEFKNSVRAAITAYVANHEIDDFIETISLLDAPELHHEIAKLLISVALDLDDTMRLKIAELLKALSQHGVVSCAQMAFAFRRLYNHIDDLALDVPDAIKLLNQFSRRAALAGYLDPDLSETLQRSASVAPEEVTSAKQQFASIVDEFFSSEEVNEVKKSLEEMNAPELHHEFVKVAILRAMDRSKRECDLTSSLLADIGVTIAACESAFESLLDRVDDFINDCPDVPRLLSVFLARAVVDECITPAFVQRIHLPEGDLGAHVLRSAAALLQMPHAAARLSNIWGPNTFEDLKTAVISLVDEYLDTGSMEEALRCMGDLGAPLYRHELVKRVFVVALDKNQRERDLAFALIERIACDNVSDGKSQVMKGIRRIKSGLAELSKDSPFAPDEFVKLLLHLKEHGHHFDV